MTPLTQLLGFRKKDASPNMKKRDVHLDATELQSGKKSRAIILPFGASNSAFQVSAYLETLLNRRLDSMCIIICATDNSHGQVLIDTTHMILIIPRSLCRWQRLKAASRGASCGARRSSCASRCTHRQTKPFSGQHEYRYGICQTSN